MSDTESRAGTPRSYYLPDDVVAWLAARAARADRSASRELARILRAAMQDEAAARHKKARRA